MSYEALGKFVDDRKEFAKTEGRDQLTIGWNNWFKAYRSYISDSYNSVAKLFIPKTFSTTFRLKSAIMSNIRQNRDLCTFLPYPKGEEFVGISTGGADFMNQASGFFMQKARATREIDKMELETAVYGTGFIKSTWKFDDGYDGLRLEHRPLNNIYIDPKVFNKAVSVDEAEYLIDTRYISFSTLSKNQKFIQMDLVREKVKNAQRSRRTDDISSQSLDLVTGISSEGSEERDKNTDLCLVEEYWGKVPASFLTNKKKETYGIGDIKELVDGHIIVAEGIVIFCEENPYPHGRIPYDVFRCYQVPNSFYGMGVPELIWPLQKAINALLNQRLDNVALILNRMWMYRNNMVNPKVLVSRPGGLIPVNGDPNTTLASVNTPDVTNSAYREQQILDDTVQQTSGVSDIFFGQSAKATRLSATEVTFQTEMGAGIMEEILAGQVQDGFIPMMEKVRDYILLFMDSPIMVRVNGIPEIIRPEQLEGEYDLTPTIGERMFSKSAELQKSIFLMQQTVQLMPVLMQQGKEVDVSKILERIYGFAGWKDYNAIVRGKPGGTANPLGGNQAPQGGGFPVEGFNREAGGHPPGIEPMFQGMGGMEGEGG